MNLMISEEFSGVTAHSFMILMTSEEFWASRCASLITFMMSGEYSGSRCALSWLSWSLKSFLRHGAHFHDVGRVLGVAVRSLMMFEECGASRCILSTLPIFLKRFWHHGALSLMIFVEWASRRTFIIGRHDALSDDL